jgi:ABC-type multidrug transport system fused ATPase/permease subunit
VSLWALLRLQTAAVDLSEQEREVSAQFYGFIEERLMALDDIRANGGGHHVMRRFTEVLRSYTSICLRAWIKRSYIWLTSFSLFGVGQVAALVVGLLLFYAQNMTLGDVFMLINYMVLLFGPIEQMANQLQDAQKAFASIERIDNILGQKRQILDGPREDLAAGPLAVRFDNVDFCYDDGEERVLKQVTFGLAPGAQLGLLGRTGSGKTTLSRLLFRFYDATAGSVQLGDVDVRELGVKALRAHIGLVTQEVQIFDASVRDNLRLFDATVPDTRLLEIIAELGLQQWFDSLPKGLDTILGPQGHGLSAGEAQLLAFGRVFIKDPGLIVLDEPSASLDPATEHLIDRTMERLLRNRTAIIIAHRLGTVQRVDEVLIMDGGEVAEHGPRERLAADPSSRFYQLLQTGMEESIA